MGVADPLGLASFGNSVGVQPKLASDYFDDSSWSGIADDQWDIDAWKGSGYQMIWAVPMLPVSGGYTIAVGATGAYDAYFTTLAQNLVAAGMGNSILRLGWEFNISTSPWFAAGQAAAFVTYWRDIVTSMRAVPGANFSFEWDVNRGDNSGSDAAMGNYDNYYPGDDYVDIIAMDVYDLGWYTYSGASQEFQSILDQQWGLDWLASFASDHDKPVAIAEMGLGWGTSAPNSGPVAGAPGPTCGGDNPTFITDMAEWVSQHNVANVVFWDYGTSSIANGSNPLTAAALLASFGEST